VGGAVSRRDGKRVVYCFSGDEVVGMVSDLRVVAECNVVEMNRVANSYYRARDGQEPVSRERVMVRLRAGYVTLLDVRPEDEFAAGHLPGALNVPLADLERRLAELPAVPPSRRSPPCASAD
jgi:hypothetical protein